MEHFNFDEAVIRRSFELPVVVDFWAEWCGPCRMLGPVIEELAQEQAGKWELVKLNTEHYPDIARQYGVMSIPNVKMFHKGEVAAEFVGALPKRSIEKWLADHIPSAEQEALRALLAEEKTLPAEVFRQRLEAFLEAYPHHTEASALLGRSLVWTAPERALLLVADIHAGDPAFALASDIRHLAHFLEASFPGETPVEKLLANAQEAFRQGQLETGIQHLIEAVGIDKDFRQDLPRLTAIAVFRLLGDQHELTRQYRWRFEMALY